MTISWAFYGLKEATGAEVCIHEKDAECLYNDERSLARAQCPWRSSPSMPMCC